MKEDEFRQALREHKVPVLILDPKWHRLFAIHGKTERIKETEKTLYKVVRRHTLHSGMPLSPTGAQDTQHTHLKHCYNRCLVSILLTMSVSSMIICDTDGLGLSGQIFAFQDGSHVGDRIFLSGMWYLARPRWRHHRVLPS